VPQVCVMQLCMYRFPLRLRIYISMLGFPSVFFAISCNFPEQRLFDY
jgi:hypothetical protein